MMNKTEHTQQPQKELSAAGYIRHLERQLTWRPAKTAPAEEGYYLVKKCNPEGIIEYSVNHFWPGYGWVVIQNYHIVLAWMPIPGTEEEGNGR